MHPGGSRGPDPSPGWIHTRARALIDSAFSVQAASMQFNVQALSHRFDAVRDVLSLLQSSTCGSRATNKTL